MVQTATQNSKSQIMTAFDRLLDEYQQQESKVATKEEEAETVKDRELLIKTADYTVVNIINRMAALQLNFGGIVNELTTELTTESDKLEELKKAIEVETKNLEQLRQVRLVADALHILRQEHQEKIRLLETRTTSQVEAIDKEIGKTRKLWEKEQQEFSVQVQEVATLLTQQREREVADYEYELRRKRQIEQDKYLEEKRLQERELEALQQEKTKNWAERNKHLADRQAEFIKNQEKAATFDEKLQEEANKSRAEAIKEAERKAKVETDLIEKEWEKIKQGNELKLESLQQTIEQQIEQINQLTLQLEQVNNQAQNLAMQAFQNK
jgi:hypothetical protein